MSKSILIIGEKIEYQRLNCTAKRKNNTINIYVLSVFKLMQLSRKVSQILDIWRAGLGVISLHIFQNVIACEAYTREACMIDAIGKYVNSFKSHVTRLVDIFMSS
jgi:hypothetical protein